MTSEMIACEGYCYASTCPRWAPCHKQWEGAEREATDVVSDAPDSAPDDTIGAERNTR